jgi:hypothetical protein
MIKGSYKAAIICYHLSHVESAYELLLLYRTFKHQRNFFKCDEGKEKFIPVTGR